MAGLKAKSGPLGNMNAFKHGLAAIQRRREESITSEHGGRHSLGCVGERIYHAERRE